MTACVTHRRPSREHKPASSTRNRLDDVHRPAAGICVIADVIRYKCFCSHWKTIDSIDDEVCLITVEQGA